MAAMAAIGGLLRKLLVMHGRDAIPAQGQIVVFVYQSDVEPEVAGGAVMAIDAAAIDGGSKRGDGGIVFFPRRRRDRRS